MEARVGIDPKLALFRVIDYSGILGKST